MNLNPSQIVEVVGRGAIASPMYALKGPKMLVGDHAPNFPLKHAHKDLKLAKDMAQGAHVEIKVMEEAEKLFSKARHDPENEKAKEKENSTNLEDLDFSAIFQVIHQQ